MAPDGLVIGGGRPLGGGRISDLGQKLIFNNNEKSSLHVFTSVLGTVSKLNKLGRMKAVLLPTYTARERERRGSGEVRQDREKYSMACKNPPT